MWVCDRNSWVHFNFSCPHAQPHTHMYEYFVENCLAQSCHETHYKIDICTHMYWVECVSVVNAKIYLSVNQHAKYVTELHEMYSRALGLKHLEYRILLGIRPVSYEIGAKRVKLQTKKSVTHRIAVISIMELTFCIRLIYCTSNLNPFWECNRY